MSDETELERLREEITRLREMVPDLLTRQQNFRTKWSLMGVPADQIEAEIEYQGENLK